MTPFVATYLCSAALALALTPLVAWLSHRLKVLDVPGPRKVHTLPTPRTGGVAIILSMLAACVPVVVLGDLGASALLRPAVLLGAALFVGLVGLADDVVSLSVRARLAAQAAAALILCAAGIRVDTIVVPGVGTLHLGVFAVPLSVLWVLAVTNSVNLADGLDGLAAGVSGAGAVVLVLFAGQTGQPIAAAMGLALLGALAGFLVFNSHPASIFMGDCGSLFVGFTLAGLGLLTAGSAASAVGLGALALALSVPLFDTFFSILRRVLERRSIFAPDRQHFHHRLLGLGLSQRQSVLVVYAVTAGAACLGLGMLVLPGPGAAVMFAAGCLAVAVVFHRVGAVRLRESWSRLRHNMKLAHEANREQKAFESAQLRLREATTFDSWWQATCAAAQEMGLSRLTLHLLHRNSKPGMMVWTAPVPPSPDHTIRTTIPLRPPGGGLPPMFAQVDVPVQSSLESASLRVTLFSRLIDENGLDWLLCQKSAPEGGFTGVSSARALKADGAAPPQDMRRAG